MLSETERDALEDIRDNIARAMRFVHGLDLDGFLRDDKTFYAATRCLEIIKDVAASGSTTDITTRTFRSGESGKRFMKRCPRFATLSI
jgi:uncharacterized protein with HEPN domain